MEVEKEGERVPPPPPPGGVSSGRTWCHGQQHRPLPSAPSLENNGELGWPAQLESEVRELVPRHHLCGTGTDVPPLPSLHLALVSQVHSLCQVVLVRQCDIMA